MSDKSEWDTESQTQAGDRNASTPDHNQIKQGLDLASVLTWSHDPSTDNLTVRPQTSRLLDSLNGNLESLEGLLSCFQPDARSHLDELVDQCLEQGTPFDVDLPVVKDKGSFEWMRVKGEPVEEGQQIVAVQGILQDVTEYKQSRQHEENGQEQFEFALQAAEAGVWELSLDEDRVVFHESMERLFNVGEDGPEESFEGLLKRVHPDDRAELKKTVQKSAQQAEEFEHVFRVITGEDEVRWVEIRSVIPDCEDNNPDRIVGVAMDVTDSRQQSIHMHTAHETAKIGWWKKDIPSDVIYWSDQIYQMWSVQGEAGLIDHEMFMSYIHPDDRDQVELAWEKAKDGATYDIEHRIVTDQGDVRWMRQSADITFDAQGNPVRAVGITQDITDRKRRETELRRQKELFDHTLKAMDDVFYVLDELGNLQLWNQSLERVTGYDKTELNSMTGTDFFEGAAQKRIEEAISTCLETGEVSLEAQLIPKDGQAIPYEFMANAFQDPEGRSLIVGIGRDVTDWKLLERELGERESKYRSLFEESRDALFLMDRDGFIDCNQKCLELYGIDDINTFKTTTPWELSPEKQPDGRFSEQAALELINEAFEDGEALCEWKHERPTGEQFDAEVKLSRIEYGNEVILLGVVRNVTEKKERLDKLRVFSKAIEEAGHAIYITDVDGTITYVNPAFESITGYTSEEVLGENSRILQSGHHDDEYYDELWSTILNGERWRSEMIDKTKSGHEFHALQTISPIMNDEGKVEKFVATMEDISDQKRIERRLRGEKDKFEKILEVHEEIVQIEMEPELTMNAIVDKVQDLTGADAGLIYLTEDDQLQCETQSGIDGFLHEKPGGFSKPIAGTIAGQALLEGELNYFQDTADADCDCLTFDFVDRGTVAFVPLVHRDERFGILEIIWDEPEALNKVKQNVIELVAGLLSSALFKSLQFEEKSTYLDEVKRLASTDQLTGLSNRRNFMDLLEDEVERADRYDQDLSLAILDLDHFKRVNDRYGHPVGDRVLSACGDLLEEELRQIDIPARYGGEEFGVIFPETSLQEAREVAQRLLEAMRQKLFEEDDYSFQVTWSIGLTGLRDGENKHSLIQRADAALYDAKESGRDCMVVDASEDT